MRQKALLEKLGKTLQLYGTLQLEKAGLVLFNRGIFIRLDFAPSSVTDRPAPQVIDAIALLGNHNVRENDPIPLSE